MVTVPLTTTLPVEMDLPSHRRRVRFDNVDTVKARLHTAQRLHGVHRAASERTVSDFVQVRQAEGLPSGSHTLFPLAARMVRT